MSDSELNSRKPSNGAWSVRAIVLGAILAVVSVFWSCYNEHILWSSGVSLEYFPVGGAFIFFVLLGATVFVRLVERWTGAQRSFALTGSELLIILIMLLVASSIPTRGLVGTWIGNIACVDYRADAINQWDIYLRPHLPQWAVPSTRDASGAVYDGVISGRPEPWLAFVTPVFWWGGFFVALMAASFFVVAILRRQWVEEERLSFPIAEVPAEMVRGMDGPGRIPDIFRNRLFWLGMLFPVIHIGLRVLHFKYPAVPGDPLRVVVWQGALPLGFPRIWLQFDWMVAGFAFLAKLDILLSLWLFYWVYFAEQVILTRLGVSVGPVERIFRDGNPVVFQMTGALFVLVLTTLWLGRRHLRAFFGKAFRPSTSDYDDSNELVSCRTAVFGLIASLLYIGVWLVRSGMEPLAAVLFIPLYLIIMIGLTRAVAESGMIWFGGPGMAQHMLITATGPALFRASTLVSLGLTWSWHQDMRVTFMPAVAHGSRDGEEELVEELKQELGQPSRKELG